MSTETVTDGFYVDTDTTGVDQDNVFSGGNSVDQEGMYHVRCATAKFHPPEDDKLPSTELQFEVLAGTGEGQIGRSLYHWLYLRRWVNSADHSQGQEPLPDQGAKSLVGFLYAFGVIGDEAFGKETFRLTQGHFEQLEGCQAIVEVRKEDDRTVKTQDGGEKTYKGRFRIPFNNAWPIGHDKVKGVPVDAEAAQYASTGAAMADDDLSDL